MHCNELYLIVLFDPHHPLSYFPFCYRYILFLFLLTREAVTSSQAVVHTILSYDDSELPLWHDPILGNDVPVRNVIE